MICANHLKEALACLAQASKRRAAYNMTTDWTVHVEDRSSERTTAQTCNRENTSMDASMTNIAEKA